MRAQGWEQFEPRQLLATFTVTSLIDRPDSAPGDGICEATPGLGDCTLRAAVQEANALSLPDQISLPAGEYLLTLGESLEDDAAEGDLDIREAVTIVGAGAADSIINGAGLDRVFHVSPVREIRGVTTPTVQVATEAACSLCGPRVTIASSRSQ
jgi:CSLREA domain-containing protein